MTFCTCSSSFDPKSIDYSSFAYFYLYVNIRSYYAGGGKNEVHAEFPFCISVTTPVECIPYHKSLPCLCMWPQITLWGWIHVVANSVPLFRKNLQLAVCFCCSFRLTSRAGLNGVLWCGSVSHGQAYLLIHLFIYFLISLLAMDVVTHDCRGLAGGNIRVLLIWLVAFGASWLEFSFFLFCV